MNKKILLSCILAAVVISAAIIGISSCGRNGRLTTITVLPENASIIPGTTQQLQAQGLLSDGTMYFLALVDWSLSSAATTTIATIDPVSGLVSAPVTTDPATGLLSTGTVTITAADPYSSFTGITSLTVDLLSSITVTPALPSMTPGLTLQFFARGILVHGATQDLTSQATLSWTSDNPAVATIVNTPAFAGTGVVTSIATGTAIIQATDLTSNISGTTMLIVTSVPLSTLTIAPVNPSPLVGIGATQQFTAAGIYSGETITHDWTPKAIWTSSNPAVATIDANGLATSVADGTTTITATDPITGIAASATLTVTTLSSITITPANPSMTPGLTYQFSATGTFANSSTEDLTAAAAWTSLTPSVATVVSTPGTAGTGVVTSVATGTAIIQATDPTSGIAGTTTLIVTAVPLASLAMTPVNPSIASNGAAQQFAVTGTYSDGTTRDWTSSAIWSLSNTSVATIEANTGKAISAVAGTTMITATDPITGIAASTTLTVTP